MTPPWSTSSSLQSSRAMSALTASLAFSALAINVSIFDAVICVSAFHVPSSSLSTHHHHNDIAVSSTKASSMFNSLLAQPIKARSRSPFLLATSSSSTNNNNNNMPSQEEIAQQKQEAYNALATFHETSYSLTKSSSAQVKSLLQDLENTSNLNDDGSADEEPEKAEYWECTKGAITYAIPMDPAAGTKRGTISKPYKSSVQVEMDLGGLRGGPKRRGLRLVESFQFGGKNNDDNEAISMPFVRSIPLGANVDVDAADGSYSLDDTVLRTTTDNEANTGSGSSPTLPLLPPSLLAGSVDPTAVEFLVEHTLAVSDTERCRCFLLYGNVSGKGSGFNDNVEEEDEDEEDDISGEEDFAIMAAKKAKESSKQTETNYRLLGVVLAEESKVMPKQEPASGNEEEGDYASDFISQMIESPSESPSSSSPLDLLEINQPQSDDSEDDKMSRLMESLDKHNQRVMDSAGGGTMPMSEQPNENAKMERHSLGMFGLTSGVWLGDTFVRESIPSIGQLSRIRESLQQKKGFGKKQSALLGNGNNADDSGSEEDRFATWHIGVQKLTLQFGWDYYNSVSQSYTYGKVMGTATSLSSMANIKSDGIVVVNQARKTKRREERRVVWDMDGGAYIAGLVGASYFRAPRYMSFSESRSYSAEALLTEFMVFYRPAADGAAFDLTSEEISEYYCSRTSRLYNANDGSLMQGSTAFFSLSQPPTGSVE